MIRHFAFLGSVLALGACHPRQSDNLPDAPIVPLVPAAPAPPQPPRPVNASPAIRVERSDGSAPANLPPAAGVPLGPILDQQLATMSSLCIHGNAVSMGGSAQWSWSIAIRAGHWVGAGFVDSVSHPLRGTIDLGPSEAARLIGLLTHAPRPPEHRIEPLASDQPRYVSMIEAHLAGGTATWTDTQDGPQWTVRWGDRSTVVDRGDPGAMYRALLEQVRPLAAGTPVPDPGGCGVRDPARGPDSDMTSFSYRAITVSGPLDRRIVERAVRPGGDRAHDCYRQRRARTPTLDGHVSVRLVIGPAGNVLSSIVTSGSPADPTFGSCVADALSRVQFPPSAGPTTVEYRYDFGG